MKRQFIFRAAFALLCGVPPVNAQGVAVQVGAIRGTVVSRIDREALAGVNVAVEGTVRRTITDARGNFQIRDLPPGSYGVTFSLVGYQSGKVSAVEVVSGQASDIVVELTAAPIQTEAVVVTASKREQSIREVPVSVSVLDAAGISFRNFVTVDEALRYIPGVNMTEFQVNVRGSSGYSRGVGSRVLLLIDGVPLLTGDTGELNYETIPIAQVDRIEVIKGASSALYGSNALGGVINVITRPIPEDPEIRLRAYAGVYSGPSYQDWDWQGGRRSLNGFGVSYARRFNDVGLQVYGSRVGDDGYRQNDSKRRYNGFLRAKYDLSSFDALTLTFNILHQERGSFLYWKDLSHALVPPDDQQGDWVRSTRFFLSGLYNHVVSTEFLYSIKALWYRNRFADNVSVSGDNSTSNSVRAEAQATWLPNRLHALTFGVEGTLDKVDADLFGRRSGQGGAVYIQDEIQVGEGWKATLGARFDMQDVDSLDANSQLNPKAGLTYSPAAGTTLRASYGRGFRSPSVAEAFVRTVASGITIEPNPRLKPESSSSFEIGANQVLGDAAVLDIALFQNDFNNLIEFGFNAAGRGQSINLTQARVQGLELSARAGFLNRALIGEVGYTYVYPKDRTKNDILRYRPRHLLYASALARAGIVSAGMDFRYMSRVERVDEEFVNLGIIQDGDQRVAAYVTDARLGADFSSTSVPLVVTLNVNNLLQYNYVELIGNLAPPRTIVLTVDLRL